MSYRVYSFGRKGHAADAKKFEEAAMMVEDGLECMREIAEDMKDEYGERMYGMRDRDWDGMDGIYGMRRRRDSLGRYR